MKKLIFLICGLVISALDTTISAQENTVLTREEFKEKIMFWLENIDSICLRFKDILDEPTYPIYWANENKWEQAEATKDKDGTICCRLVKEIDDEEVSMYAYYYRNGDFFIVDKDNHFVGDYVIHGYNGLIEMRKDGKYYIVFPNASLVKVGSISRINKERKDLGVKEDLGDEHVFEFGQIRIRRSTFPRLPYINEASDFYNKSRWSSFMYFNCWLEKDLSESGYFISRLPSHDLYYKKYTNGYFNEYYKRNGEIPIKHVDGFLIGNRICNINNEGNPIPKMKYIKGLFWYANENDSIIDVKDSISEGYIAYEFFYENGDKIKWVKRGYDRYLVGSIHRNGGVLQFKKNQAPMLTKPDGTKITYEKIGTEYFDSSYMGFPVSKMEGYSFEFKDLALDSFELCTGTITYPDGRTEEYRNGHPDSFWHQKVEEYEKAEEAKRNAEKAKEKAELAKKRNSCIQKWGFYPGDYDTNSKWKQCIIPGRPFGAIQEYFSTSLIQNNGSAKYYKVNTYGKHEVYKDGKLSENESFLCFKNAYVWVRNGKITSVSWK